MNTSDFVSDHLIEIKDLSFSRGNRKIFDNLSLVIPRGKVTAIMGPSGTGKTTLLKIIGGQLRPDSGSVWVDDQEVHALSNKELYQLRKRMGMLFQSGALLTDLTVGQNVGLPLQEHTDLPERMICDLVSLKLQAVGLRGAINLMPSELSGGMSRRVALARAIALDPMMIMYDEPFTGQDPISMGVLVELIRTMNDALGLTSVMVSHDIQESMSIADYVCLISGGVLIEAGTPEELSMSTSAWVQQFLRGQADGPVPFHFSAPALMDQLMEVTSC